MSNQINDENVLEPVDQVLVYSDITWGARKVFLPAFTEDS